MLNERQGFFCIRGSDLDRLEEDDFRAIEAWLADAPFIAPKKQPQPHQTEALDALLPALETHDRVSAIMACGTGKTLVALWVAERRQASRILVLVPSLALLRQVLHEWLCHLDSAIHFYNRSPLFAQRLQEIGTASVKNFAAAAADWFKTGLFRVQRYLMPLSFVRLPARAEALILNPEEKNFLTFIESLETTQDDPAGRYSVSVNIEIKFTNSKAKDALGGLRTTRTRQKSA